jgi:hypothetical protein
MTECGNILLCRSIVERQLDLAAESALTKRSWSPVCSSLPHLPARSFPRTASRSVPKRSRYQLPPRGPSRAIDEQLNTGSRGLPSPLAES